MAPIIKSLINFALSAACSKALCLPHIAASPPTLPLSEVDNALPAPSGDVKFVTLGLGFQNYTCTSTGTYVQSVVSAGAIASLYDITSTVSMMPGDAATRTSLRAFETCLKMTKCTPTTQNGYCDSCHNIAAAAYRRNDAGEHFFDQMSGSQTPNFDIKEAGMFLSVKKSAGCKAPADSYTGQNGLGTVDWLYLIDNGLGRSKGLSSVYRVQTAGGVAPKTCDKAGSVLQVPYAAEYWFYQ